MNHVEFRQLRLRLGWSLAEMARRMGCHQSVILKWESNDLKPEPEVIRQYMALQGFVEENAERIRQMPIAETFLKDEHLYQCTQEDIQEWEKDTESTEDKSDEH